MPSAWAASGFSTTAKSVSINGNPCPSRRWKIGWNCSTVCDGATIVVGRVAGDFPNSPIELDHIFRLEGDKIASLDIR